MRSMLIFLVLTISEAVDITADRITSDYIDITDITNERDIHVKLTPFIFDINSDTNNVSLEAKSQLEQLHFCFCEGKNSTNVKRIPEENAKKWTVPIETNMQNLVQIISKNGISCVVIGETHLYSFKIFDGLVVPNIKRYKNVDNDKLSDPKYHLWLQIVLIFMTIITFLLIILGKTCCTCKLKKQ